MRRFSTGRYIDQEELELWTLPGWFPALGKPGFPQIPELRRLGVIDGIPETDRLQIPTPERGPGPEAGITAGYAPVWGRRNRKPPTDSAEEAKLFLPAFRTPSSAASDRRPTAGSSATISAPA